MAARNKDKKTSLGATICSDNRSGVDYYGYLRGVGWIVCGWIEGDKQSDEVEAIPVTLEFDAANVFSTARAYYFNDQEEVSDVCGFLLVVNESKIPNQELGRLAFEIAGRNYTAAAQGAAYLVDEADLKIQVSNTISTYRCDEVTRKSVLGLLGRPIYQGVDTIDLLSVRVLIGIDEAIDCDGRGLLLFGWSLVPHSLNHRIVVRNDYQICGFDIDASLRHDRADVLEAFANETDIDDLRNGFCVFVPMTLDRSQDVFLEVELVDSGEIGFKRVVVSRVKGIGAIKFIASRLVFEKQEIGLAFDRAYGRAIGILNDARLAKIDKIDVSSCGNGVSNAVVSIVIPVYGRIDFVEYQLGLMAFDEYIRTRCEVIFVVDDPGKRKSIEDLFVSLYARFEIAFRAVFMERNLGFAPACNRGLRDATAPFVCFLNSDVFPAEEAWLSHLVDVLESNPKIGIVGPRLLFEDGSIQHEGCVDQALENFNGWKFPKHVNKGLKPSHADKLMSCEAVTGACLLIGRELALDLGGFDEQYIVGDFEDADLCKRVVAAGYQIAVDPRINLYHLERKSQVSPDKFWRSNLTLYNAWLYQRRWYKGAAGVGEQP